MNLSLIRAYLCATGLKAENIYTVLARQYINIIDRSPPMNIDQTAPFLLAMVGVIPYIKGDFTVTMYQNDNTITPTVYLDGKEIMTFLISGNLVMVTNPASMHSVPLTGLNVESELISKLFAGMITKGVNIERLRHIVQYLLHMQDILDKQVIIDVEEMLKGMKQDNTALGEWLDELIVELPERYTDEDEVPVPVSAVEVLNGYLPKEEAEGVDALTLFRTACEETILAKTVPEVRINPISSTDFQLIVDNGELNLCYGITQFEDYPISFYADLRDGSDFDTIEVPTDTLINFVERIRSLLIGAPWYRLDSNNVTVKQTLDNFVFHVLDTLTNPSKSED